MANNNHISLGFSPCPNDTFMFYGMVHETVDTEGLHFDVTMADVEELNQLAFKGQLQATKLSYYTFAKLTNQYILLDSGSALGNNCGPLLICKNPDYLNLSDLSQLRIAIPGENTTANFLLSIYAPEATNKQAVLFSEIESLVLNNTFDAGLIIHENRFTYYERGLHKIVDLGEYWQDLSNAPIPLGGIVVRRDVLTDIQHKLNRVMKRSVEFAFANPTVVMPYVKKHAQEMDELVMQQHINLYVNKYSINLGADGEKAIQCLFDKAVSSQLIDKIDETIFLTQA